jgi:hypothetical protein
MRRYLHLFGRPTSAVAGILLTFILCFPANGAIFGGVEFPQGVSSFADVVTNYSPEIDFLGQPTAGFRHPEEALGPPNSDFVSLGEGGSIILWFTDNVLTGSGTPAADLWIFEVVPPLGFAERTFVEISETGLSTDWHFVGIAGGGTSGIDIDASGFGVDGRFFFVRLRDDPNDNPIFDVGSTGADIDAVGAISTEPIPEPATLALWGSIGLIGLVRGSRRRRKHQI